MTEGYIVLATGPAKYVDMAVNLGCSLKVLDPGRSACLVHSPGAALPPLARRVFDTLIPLEDDPRFPHVMAKLRLFELSPYHSTMFVDADCLLVKKDVDHWWRAAQRQHFSVTGTMQRGGRWKGADMAKLMSRFGIDEYCCMNAGVYHFDKTPEGLRFSRDFMTFFLENRDALAVSNYKGPNSYSFELCLGIFVGMKKINVDNMSNYFTDIENSWMVSTWQAVYSRFRVDGEQAVIYKASHFLFDLPFLPSRLTPLSPTFAHFIALKPTRLYNRLARDFRTLVEQRDGAPAAASTAPA